MSTSIEIGLTAEQLSFEFLTEQGLKPIQRNFSCKLGEIDLIMQDNQTLVFVEVRYRKSNRYGNAAATVTAAKRTKLTRTAAYYLQQQRLTHKIPCRFDVIAINGSLSMQHITWIKNAF